MTKLNAATKDRDPLVPGHPATRHSRATGWGGGEAEQSGTRFPRRRPTARSPGGKAGPAASPPAPRGGTAHERMRDRVGHRRRRQFRAPRPPAGAPCCGWPAHTVPVLLRTPPGPLPADGCSPREAALRRGATSAASTSSSTTRMAPGGGRGRARGAAAVRAARPRSSSLPAARRRSGACALRSSPRRHGREGAGGAAPAGRLERCGGGGAGAGYGRSATAGRGGGWSRHRAGTCCGLAGAVGPRRRQWGCQPPRCPGFLNLVFRFCSKCGYRVIPVSPSRWKNTILFLGALGLLVSSPFLKKHKEVSRNCFEFIRVEDFIISCK